MRTMERTIDLQGNGVQLITVHHATVRFDTGMCVQLKNKDQYCYFTVDNGFITVKYLKKWDHKVRSMVQTWQNLISKYTKRPLFRYVVKPVYNYFPLVIDVQLPHIHVNNYLGLKKVFKIKLNDYVSVEKQKKDVVIHTHNDIITGSDLEKLRALRYKTSHKRLDRRVFTDGFHIIKQCVHA